MSRFLRALALAAAPSLLGGCIIVHDTNDTPHNTSPSTHVDAVDIDVAPGEIVTDPGEGASIIVEYAGNGVWNVRFTCDSKNHGYACHYDLYTRSPGIRMLQDHDLEDGDYLEEYGDQLHASFVTDIDTDGFSFDTPLGEEVEIEAYNDGDNANNVIFWIGDGVLHKEGAPTNPTVFIPPPGQ
ncbi:MAG: hypothetical protein U0414_14940 [Polyangiaceae bacterium]